MNEKDNDNIDNLNNELIDINTIKEEGVKVAQKNDNTNNNDNDRLYFHLDKVEKIVMKMMIQ